MGVTADLITYYQNLLIMQFAGQAKAAAHISAQVTPVLLPQGTGPSWTDPPLPLAVREAFNLVPGTATATGVQLDLLGKYAGVVRGGLSDADFLTLIRLGIARNSADSSLAGIQTFIAAFFPGQLAVFDSKNMQMSYLVATSLGPLALIKTFVAEGLLPKPSGVALASVIYAPVITTFFGFRTYLVPPHNISPFNTYASYQTNRPWLSYTQAVSS